MFFLIKENFGLCTENNKNGQRHPCSSCFHIKSECLFPCLLNLKEFTPDF